MLAVSILLMVLLIGQSLYLFYYKNQIKDIANQLAFISKHHSFKFIETQIKPKEIDSLIRECNGLLTRIRAVDQQAALRNEEVNDTVISLSHDIRTPLTSLDGYLQLAERSQDPQEHTRYVTLARSRIQLILKLVDELFLYTKLQNPEYRIDLKPIDVIALLKRSLFSFMDEFAAAGEEPQISLPESTVVVMAQGNALERVFENILRNYFVHGAGSLSIRYEDQQNRACIHFANLLPPGSTVNPDQIFTRFYKADSSRTVHSSGLGLSIVKSLVDKMDGHTQAELTGELFCISAVFNKILKEITYE
ncbi:sensor histidine kinase [Paenibacillus donghaensis]|uniref:histidine kinase n=1 Tax=Paenibacillus donghaensis TaxID=414771 RepID=A0A2Z2KJ21_9BACL|nr:HAMP domain-containing sensor histidine kinase [Paenibacillus donghaensis]ASA23260.1 hypothetical protein B9T62_22085 [Paenibacillus donghaensis]